MHIFSLNFPPARQENEWKIPQIPKHHTTTLSLSERTMVDYACAVKELCLNPEVAEGVAYNCVDCGHDAHEGCCVQFYMQSPDESGRIVARHLTTLGKQCLRHFPTNLPEVRLCLSCEEFIKKKMKKITTFSSTFGSTQGQEIKWVAWHCSFLCPNFRFN